MHLKKSLLVLCSLVSLCTSAQIQSNCSVPPNLLAAYDLDVKALAIERMYAIKTPDTASIWIPQKYQDTIWRGLAAIFNLDTQLQVDSIFRRYCVHAHKAVPPGLNASLNIYFDTSFAWTQAWRDTQTTTGYGALDSFLQRYNYTVESYFSVSSFHIARIESPHSLNRKAVKDSLVQFDGLTSVWDSYGSFKHRDIIYRKDGTAKFIFEIGWGDCLAGCVNRKYWHYSVDEENCTVALDTIVSNVYSYYEFTPPGDCELYPTNVTAIRESMNLDIHPNPASDFVWVRPTPEKLLFYYLHDFSGRMVQKGALDSAGKIWIGDLSPGVYLLHLFDKATRKQIKVVKF